jgi:PEP-CTERM motif-containing protein
MSVPKLWLASRRWPLVFALLLLTAPAFADSITIGSLTYVGWGDPSHPSKAKFVLQLNTEGRTFYRDFPGWQLPLVLDVQVFGWDAGVFQTIPATGALLNPPHYCPCEGVVFNMSLLETYPFRLANGELFTPSPTITVSFYVLPGQTYLQTGQSVAIVLNSLPSPVPEPASLLLLANGLLATAGVVWRKRRALAR